MTIHDSDLSVHQDKPTIVAGSAPDAGLAAQDGDATLLPGQRFPDAATLPLFAPTSVVHGHGTPMRGLSSVPASRLDRGLFGRMFRRLPALRVTTEQATRMAGRMQEQDHGDDPARDNPDVPALYTYFGQFIDHDLTFDPMSSLQRQNDPDALTNFRTPRFDLDCLYGRGPHDQPYLYDGDTGRFLFAHPHAPNPDPELVDHQRNAQQRALIGDPRNDENLLVSQVQLLWQHVHNAVLDHLGEFPEAAPIGLESPFEAAQRVVRWHYQWVVVHDFLRRILGEGLLADLLPTGRLVSGGEDVRRPHLQFFSYHDMPFMPIEFSVGAYRFGHSMIRNSYVLNSFVGVRVPPVPIFMHGSVQTAGQELHHLGGFRQLPPFWQLELGRFLDLGSGTGTKDGANASSVQHSRLIDTKLSDPLADLPPEIAGTPNSLAVRNILRGSRLGLPSGQTVAMAMGVRPISRADLDFGRHDTPLWCYVLKEAELLCGGRHLGPVGGRIVGEVFLGLMQADGSSFLASAPGWRPFLPAAHEGTFTLADAVRFSGFGTAEVLGPGGIVPPKPTP